MNNLFTNIDFLDEETFREKSIDEELDDLLNETFSSGCPYLSPNEAIKITKGKEIELDDDEDSPLDESFDFLSDEDFLNEAKKNRPVKGFMNSFSNSEWNDNDETVNVEEDLDPLNDPFDLYEEGCKGGCGKKKNISDDDLAESDEDPLDENYFFDLGL